MAKLFETDRLVGMFKGFAEEGLEFRAEIVSPYQASEDLTPRIGQFLLVELGTPDEAALGRITRFFPVGVLAGREGDEYLAEMQRSNTEVPAQLKERRLRYNVKVRLLGGIRVDHGADQQELRFVPTVRKLPHLGARVAVPSDDTLKFLCNLGAQSDDAQPIGFFNLGEIVYNGGKPAGEEFLLPQSQELEVRFDVTSLISKRSFVFARAGYGKSNMLKLLISQLYAGQGPRDRNGRSVGMLILDPEGEYFWPDDDGRPGLCNVPELREKIAVFTDRPPRNAYFGSWKAGGIKLDLRALDASDVVSMCVPSDRQNQQNVTKLRSLRQDRWSQLIDLIAAEGHNAEESEIQSIAGFKESEGVEARAMRSNVAGIISRLHDPGGSLQSQVLNLLRDGMIVIVDLSLVSGKIGLEISGLLLKSIFDNNQYNFTSSSEGQGIVPTIAVLEEAQSVLGPRASEESPFVQWAKEGRKYGLGAIMVTQQPGSIAPLLLSQGDNFFTFHLLSANDLRTLQHHNAHFSDDILASILNEPIKGNCFFWSAPDQPFVLPARILNFDEIGQQHPDEATAGESQPVRAGEVEVEFQNTENDLASVVYKVLHSVDGSDGVEFYELPEGRAELVGSVACYKPRLSAQVAEKLRETNPTAVTRFCSSDGQWVNDQHLEQALTDCGIVQSVIKIKAIHPRNQRQGDFYLVPRSSLNNEIEIRSPIEIVDDST